jgi:hypothetical protein
MDCARDPFGGAGLGRPPASFGLPAGLTLSPFGASGLGSVGPLASAPAAPTRGSQGPSGLGSAWGAPRVSLWLPPWGLWLRPLLPLTVALRGLQGWGRPLGAPRVSLWLPPWGLRLRPMLPSSWLSPIRHPTGRWGWALGWAARPRGSPYDTPRGALAEPISRLLPAPMGVGEPGPPRHPLLPVAIWSALTWPSPAWACPRASRPGFSCL